MKKSRECLVFIVIALILLSSSGVLAKDNVKFKDVKSTDWYYGSVANLTNKEIISGYNDNTFRPNNSVTVAEFLKLSMEVAQIKYDNTTSLWYKDLMQKALDIGIINKSLYEAPNTPIKRKDVALTLTKLIEKTPSLKSEFVTERSKEYDRFKYLIYDTTKLSQEYRNAIYKLFEYQLIVGTTNNKDQVFYNPESNLTRAEVAAIVERLIEPSKRLDKYKEYPNRKSVFARNNKDELNQVFSVYNALPDVENRRFIYTEEILNQKTEKYILEEKLNPNINKQIYDLSQSMISEGYYVEATLMGTIGSEYNPINPRVKVQFASSAKSAENNSGNWTYMFYEKEPFNAKYDSENHNVSDKVIISLDLSKLFGGSWKHVPKSYTELNGLVEYEFVNKFRSSIIAVFGEQEGQEIFEYIFSEYTTDRSDSSIKYTHTDAKWKHKTIGKYKIDYMYGDSSVLVFNFSFID